MKESEVISSIKMKLKISEERKMAFKAYYFKDFTESLRKLSLAGKRREVTKCRAATAEAQTEGEIKSLNRTNNGENRIPNCEKYDLGDGYRLIVQLIDGVAKSRVFLFAGSHDDATLWLDQHKGYKWVQGGVRDKSLEFVRVTDDGNVPLHRENVNVDSSRSGRPLLSFLNREVFQQIGIKSDVIDYVLSISAADYEGDPYEIMEFLGASISPEFASLIIDAIDHANRAEFEKARARIEVFRGKASVVDGGELTKGFDNGLASEEVIHISDEEGFYQALEEGRLSEWMIFLHPVQRRVSAKDFNGPARLRGISGSGKTSVLVHRVAYLSKKYEAPIFVITLTESMRKLLEELLKSLMGVNFYHSVRAMTTAQFCKYLVSELHPVGDRAFVAAKDSLLEGLMEDAIRHSRSLDIFKGSSLSKLEFDDFSKFIRAEVAYIRSMLLPENFDTYLDAKAFARKGRGIGLTETGRRICLEAAKYFDSGLSKSTSADCERMCAEALKLLRGGSSKKIECRSIVVDEVQDFSQLEMEVLANIQCRDGFFSKIENGLFLAGDGAQSIFNKGFSFKKAGVEISNRSFALVKNYRNTYEILDSAYELIKRYEFSDSDEDEYSRPMSPEFAARHGQLPKIVGFEYLDDEIEWVCSEILGLIQVGVVPGQICVVGFSNKIRSTIFNKLRALNVAVSDLRDDVSFDSVNVKISTAESAKGHEFSNVYVVGVIEGLMPSREAISQDSYAKDASRLYVAMTRARDSLCLSYSVSGTMRPSRFLSSIAAKCRQFQRRKGARELIELAPW